jgi:hypothetical protein
MINQETKDLLKTIVDFINTHDQSSNTPTDLWSILTALRGPDDGDAEAKVATTGVIRNHLGLNTEIWRFVVCKDKQTYAELRQKCEFTSSHFFSHARIAFQALGLKWNEVNE